MEPFLLMGSLALSAGGTYMQMEGAKKSAAANKEAVAAQQRAEDARKAQMELDAQRRSREIVRQQQRARSLALTSTTGQGAQFGSALGGSYGQIAGQTGVNLTGVGQNLLIGRDIFAANADLNRAKMSMADAQAYSAFGSGLSSFGGALVRNMGPMSNLFNNFFPRGGGFGGASAMNNDPWQGMR